MRCAIIGDIHANLTAFKAVLDDLERRGGFDTIWCLGDTVGYGPEPHGCIELLKQYSHVSVAGNHDWAAIGTIDTSDFNEDAALANKWTASQLMSSDISFINSLQLKVIDNNFTFVHGSPREPIWEYLLSTRSAADNFELFETNVCLVGHSHIPLVFEYNDGRVILLELNHGAEVHLGKNRLILNPGSVGQPRDNDPRASYAIYDDSAETIYHYRVEYDIKATQKQMAESGLPEFLIQRLSNGL
jgi:diadenosine tetraphosphatase ApaH/serine/threonine PP2A family protein phosphatase